MKGWVNFAAVLLSDNNWTQLGFLGQQVTLIGMSDDKDSTLEEDYQDKSENPVQQTTTEFSQMPSS